MLYWPLLISFEFKLVGAWTSWMFPRHIRILIVSRKLRSVCVLGTFCANATEGWIRWMHFEFIFELLCNWFFFFFFTFQKVWLEFYVAYFMRIKRERELREREREKELHAKRSKINIEYRIQRKVKPKTNNPNRSQRSGTDAINCESNSFEWSV